MIFEEVNGIQNDAGKKVLIYGQEGVGKSSLASCFPDAVFIDCEGSTTMMNVRRLPKPENWQMLIDEMNYIFDVHTVKNYWTVVIDTFDWAERLALESICREHNVNGIEGFGYGKGWQYEIEAIGKFLDLTEHLIQSGVNVVFLCHAITKRMTLPEDTAEFDHWELKLGNKTTNKIAPLLKEWSDMTLFLAFKTNIVPVSNDGKKNKATAVQRVMYTTKTAWWDAKNRFGLPEMLPIDFKAIAHLFPKAVTENPAEQMIETAKKEEIPVQSTPAETIGNLNDFQELGTESFDGIPQKLIELMKASGVTPSMLQIVSSKFLHYFPETMPVANYPADYFDYVVNNWQSETLPMIRANCPDYVPF